MTAFVFALIALGLLIYGVEFTLHAGDKYKALKDKKMEEEMFLPELRIERYTCPIEKIEVSFIVDSYNPIVRQQLHDDEYKKRLFEREMRIAKQKLFDIIMESNQYLEIEIDEDHKYYTNQEIYTLTLRVANISLLKAY